jgi:hypothetical protein
MHAPVEGNDKSNTAMYNITLISTRHDDIGECNSFALWQILEALGPQVIFLELPPSYLSISYIDRTNKLEMNAVRPYINAHKPILVAVDIDGVSKTFVEGYKRIFDELKKLQGPNGLDFYNSVNTNQQYAAMYGFKYLNSEYGIAHSEAVREATMKGLEQINNDRLTDDYNAWIEHANNRENEMLQNIYIYSKDYPYERAVFLLGAAHRSATIKKIKSLIEIESFKLNWSFYDG